MNASVLNIYGEEECTRITDPQAHTLFLVKTEKACDSILIFETVVNQELTTDRDYFYLSTRCNRIKRLVRNEYKAATFSFFSLKRPTKKLLISVGIFRESSGEISVAKRVSCWTRHHARDWDPLLRTAWDIGITRFDGMNYEGFKLKTAFGNLKRVQK